MQYKNSKVEISQRCYYMSIFKLEEKIRALEAIWLITIHYKAHHKMQSCFDSNLLKSSHHKWKLLLLSSDNQTGSYDGYKHDVRTIWKWIMEFRSPGLDYINPMNDSIRANKDYFRSCQMDIDLDM